MSGMKFTFFQEIFGPSISNCHAKLHKHKIKELGMMLAKLQLMLARETDMKSSQSSKQREKPVGYSPLIMSS
jgi:hypothetical protein